VHFPDPDDADEGDDFSGRLVLGILALALSLFIAYFVAPAVARYFECPARTLFSASTASRAGIVAAFLLLPAAFILIICTGFEVNDRFAFPVWVRRHKAFSISLAAAAFALNAVVIINMALSYYCVVPDGIVLGSGITAAGETLTWDEVREVQGLCWSRAPGGRGSWHALYDAALLLEFNSGQRVRIYGGTFSVIRNALLGHYNYQFSTSHLERCPASARELFGHWQD
jgi:hypothetical protein